MSTDESDPSPVDDTQDADEEEVEPASPDSVYALRIAGLLSTYSLRQAEVLRLAEYMEERSAEIDNAAARARALIRAQLDAVEKVDEIAIEKLIGLFEDIQDDDENDLSQDDRRDAFVTALQDVSDSLPEGRASTYMDSVLRAIHAPPGANLLRSSLLVTLVGELEMFINHLARACFERQPETLDDSGRSFSWTEISRHDSIADMRDAVVDRAIEDVLRGSLTEWVDYFVKRFKISDVAIARTLSAQEAIQRRHCIVHNGGAVSSQYLERLASFSLKVEVGDDLDVDTNYLREASDVLFLVAYSLAWALGFKLCGDPETREALASRFANRTYFLIQEGRFDLVKLIGRSVPLEKLEEETALVMQVNYWLAFKLSGDFESIRSEVLALKVNSKSRRFNLAKFALLDQHEEALRVAESMIRDDELKSEHLFTWPLLAGVRDLLRKKSESPEVATDEPAR